MHTGLVGRRARSWLALIVGVVPAAACSSKTSHSSGGSDGAGGDGASASTSRGGSSATSGGTSSTSGPGGGGAGAQDGGTGGVAACTPGERQCDGLIIQACNQQGDWAATGATCALGCVDGTCTECSDAAVRCADGAVEQCAAGAWTVVEVCEVTCEASECVDACTEGRMQCSNLDLQVCDGGQYVTQEECEFLCVDGECTGSCAPDSRRCNPDASNESQSCDAAGEWGDPVACEGETPLCRDDLDYECGCDEGERRCGSSDNVVPEECQDGVWVEQDPCSSSTPVCEDGTCVPEPTECGNGEQEEGEECDDGEATTTCSDTCTSCVDPGFTTVLDQSRGYCTDGSFTCGTGWARQNGQSIAQQFVVSEAGSLSEVELYVQNEVAVDKPMTLEIIDAGADANLMDGANTQELEASYVVATAQANGNASGPQWESFDFSDQNVTMEPSSTYYLWLRMPPEPVTSDSEHIRWNLWMDEAVEDPYPGGRPYFCPGTSCQLEVQPYWDYSFRVRLSIPPPLCE